MKTGRSIDFSTAADPQAAVQLLLRVRLAEVLERQKALSDEDDEAIHAFRLACKRLRFAIERAAAELPRLQPAAALLSNLTDELGAAHDGSVLVKRAVKSNAPLVALHARRDRAQHLDRARRLWHRSFRNGSPLEALAEYTGYSWSAE